MHGWCIPKLPLLRIVYTPPERLLRHLLGSYLGATPLTQRQGSHNLKGPAQNKHLAAGAGTQTQRGEENGPAVLQ